MGERQFVITGGNFHNKGAQSMLFVTISELRRRFPNCRIYMTSSAGKETEQPLAFEIISASVSAWQYSRGGPGAVAALLKSAIKYYLGNKMEFSNIFRLKRILKGTDAVIDISGYSISSQWGHTATKRYLDVIRAAKALRVPMFLMPQSFGPFEYKKGQTKMLRLLKKHLSIPVCIFAREENGYRRLTEELHLRHVKRASDLVLGNKSIDPASIFAEEYSAPQRLLPAAGNVAIIPNMRNFDHGDPDMIIRLYDKIINLLIALGKDVYLVRHSTEDLQACHMIYAQSKHEKLHLLEDDFDCIELDSIIRQCDYLVASRYHAIVCAYKAGIPAIALGWAEKYHALLDAFGQSKYIFDVRGDISWEQLRSAIMSINDNVAKEEVKIKQALESIQRHNCFDVVYNFFRSNN